MTNRPSEILKAALHPDVCVSGHAEKLYSILDSHAARLESLERADSPPLSPDAKSSSRGVRFTKIVNSDIDIVVYAYDEDEKCWFCPRDGNIVLSVVQERHTDEIDITREQAVTLRPAIATRWAEASPPVQSEQPGKAEGENEMARRFYCERHEGILKHQISDRLVADLLAFAKQYAASRDARIAVLEDELKDSNHMLDCNRRGVTRLSDEATARSRNEQHQREEIGKLHSRIATLEAELAKAQSKLGTVKDHLTQWNLATTNAAANQAMSNAFNEVTE